MMDHTSAKLVSDFDGQKRLAIYNHNQGKVVIQTVREEEEYMKHLDTIIQRDYFPHLTNVSGRHTDASHNPEDSERSSVWSKSDSRLPEKKDPSSLNLDKYLANNTTEDDASFAELIEESEKKRRIRLATFFPSIEAVTKSDSNETKPLALTGGSQVNVGPRLALSGNNPVHFNPDGVSQTHDEFLDYLTNERKIVPANTRFKRPFPVNIDKTSLVKRTILGKLGRVGLDGKESESPLSTPQAAGYRFLDASPSPAMSAYGTTPLMTWGELDATPSRLDDLTPSVISGVPAFRIPSPSKREQLAHKLADKAGRQRARDRNEAVKRVHSGMISPSSHSLLSPAARRLLANTSSILSRPGTGSTTPVDKSATPRRLQSGDLGVVRRPTTSSSNRTPLASPAPRKSATSSKVDSGQPIPNTPTQSITDNLLNLRSNNP